MKIGIINTGVSNVTSIHNMLGRLGTIGKDIRTPSECIESEALILPGVGHFNEGMRALKKDDLIDTIMQRVNDVKVPILGICLGMQLLCSKSEEGSEPGMGLIDADVKKFQFSADEKLKVPHMGWNIVRPGSPNPLIPRAEEEQRFYFVHSYRVIPNDQNIVIGTTNYGDEFCAAFQKDNIFGVQFHPEKSHRFGMALMKRFVEL